MDYATAKPIEDRIHQLHIQQQDTQKEIEHLYSKVSEHIHVIEGLKRVLQGINSEITHLSFTLNPEMNIRNQGQGQSMPIADEARFRFKGD